MFISNITMSYACDIFTPDDACIPKPSAMITNNKHTLTDLKKLNNDNYCTVKLQLNKKWKGYYLKTATISYYKTLSQCGSRIIHAITGDELHGLVGSREENRYFKVKMTAFGGETNNGSIFYLSPYEYENHQYCEVSQSAIDKWNARQ